MTLRVMTVCTGNLCRSPLAERLLDLRCRAVGLDVVVDSGGTKATNGAAIHRETLRVLESLGGDGSDFGARLLTPRLLAGHDLVLTATRAHRDVVQELAPMLWKKSFTLLEAAELTRSSPDLTLSGLHAARRGLDGDDPALDVEDPIGREPEVFDRTGRQISDAVDSVVELLARS